jgi:sugar phosphate permease
MGFTYAYFFGLTWLPTYLVQQRGIALAKMGWVGAMPFWSAAVGAIVAAYIADSLIGKGRSATTVRKGFVVAGLLLSTTAYPSATVEDLTLSLVLLNLSYVGLGLVLSNHWAITQTLAGPLAAGRWSGAKNCVGAVMGIIAPIASGYIVQATGNYSMAFLVMAAFAVIGALAYVFVVGKVKPVDWQARKAKASSV